MLPSAFGLAGAGQGGPPDKRVRITVVAPRLGELPGERSNSSFYGSSALDWKPYAPGSVRPIAQDAAGVARSLEYWADVGDLGQHEEDLLSGDPRSGPQILIVDPWALLVPPVQQLLRQFDLRRLPWVQVMIPWSASDEETRKAKEKLRVALDATLHNKLNEVKLTSAMAALGVPGPDDFDRVLRQLIGTVTQKYLGHAAAHPPRGEAVERPRIS
jgi:FxsC-like protein